MLRHLSLNEKERTELSLVSWEVRRKYPRRRTEKQERDLAQASQEKGTQEVLVCEKTAD